MEPGRAKKRRPRLTDEERDRRERAKKQRAAEKQRLKAQQVARITRNAQAARDLMESVRAWHDKHLKGWRRALVNGDLHTAAAKAADLAAKLRSGEVQPPPWPDDPWPVAAAIDPTQMKGALGRLPEVQVQERQALLNVLDSTALLRDQGDRREGGAAIDAIARLREDADKKLESILAAAGATKSGRGRRRKTVEANFGDLTIAEEAILSEGGAIREVDLATGEINVRAPVSTMPSIAPPSTVAIQRSLDKVMGTHRAPDSYGRLRRLRRRGR